MDAPCKIQGNIHVLLCLIHKINVSRILGTYHICCGAYFCYILAVKCCVRISILLVVTQIQEGCQGAVEQVI